jgi:hypothetical protein
MVIARFLRNRIASLFLLENVPVSEKTREKRRHNDELRIALGTIAQSLRTEGHALPDQMLGDCLYVERFNS